MTLKNLKDLKTHNYSGEVIGYINPDELKAEAINWVLDMLKYNKNPFKAWIKFFNIDEEYITDIQLKKKEIKG